MGRDFMKRETIFSQCRRYRYTLWREFGGELIWDGVNKQKDGFVQFIGLNPSTADETLDDPTIRRCIGFAKAWGYGAMCMTNLFAFRATDPKDMKAQTDPIGPDNNDWLCRIGDEAETIVAAWGTHGSHLGRDEKFRQIWGNNVTRKLHCLKKTVGGHPSHPLYLPKTSKLIEL